MLMAVIGVICFEIFGPKQSVPLCIEVRMLCFSIAAVVDQDVMDLDTAYAVDSQAPQTRFCHLARKAGLQEGRFVALEMLLVYLFGAWWLLRVAKAFSCKGK